MGQAMMDQMKSQAAVTAMQNIMSLFQATQKIIKKGGDEIKQTVGN